VRYLPIPTLTRDDIEIGALREKYLQERDKRLHPEGSNQYLELKDDFAEFARSIPEWESL
jgi:cyclohexanone monooxygenase